MADDKGKVIEKTGGMLPGSLPIGAKPGDKPHVPMLGEEAAPKVKHVKMKRKYPQHQGGPVTADVHPDEVENYSDAGWLHDKSEDDHDSKREGK